MKEKFTCNICGKDHDDLTSYMKCVSKCGEKALKEREAEAAQKYLEEVNAGLNRIKEAEKYLESVKKEFKEKYPEEYDLNFGDNNVAYDIPLKLSTKSENDDDNKFKAIEVELKSDGKGKPTINARVNGTKVDNDSIEKLFADPEVNYLARLLGIL